MIFINAHVDLTNNQFEPRHVFEHPKSFTHLKMLPFLSPLLWKHLNKLGRGLNLTRATGDRFWFNQYIFATKTGASQRFTTLKTWNPRSFGLAIPMCPWNNDDDSNVFPGSNSGLVPWFKTGMTAADNKSLSTVFKYTQVTQALDGSNPICMTMENHPNTTRIIYIYTYIYICIYDYIWGIKPKSTHKKK
jgi:hypothetical protein